MEVEVANTTHDGMDWACIMLAIGAMGELFAFDTVLLVGEGDRGEGGSGALGGRGGRGIKMVAATNFELNIN